MPDQWRRFREKLRQVPPVSDIDGSESVPIVHGEGTRSIRLDQIVELGLDPSRANLPPAAPGTLCPTFGPVAPGWLKCDGRLISRAEYPRLFAVIGDAYGKGDGATTFALPDIKTRLTHGNQPDAIWMIAT